MMLLIVAAVLLTFGRLCRYQFITWDDEPFLARHPQFVDPSWQNVAYFWTHPYLTIYVPVTTTLWQLLAWAAHRGQPDAAGIVLDPHWFHTANVLVHAGNALIVFVLLRRLLRHPWAACAGAMVFALHPVQVETVGWISGLKDLLAGTGSLAAILLYLMAWDDSASRRRRRWLYVASCLVIALAMLSKPSALTTPAVALVIDLWLMDRPWRRAVLRLAPWFLMSLATAILARSIQPPITGVSDLGYAAYTPIAQRPFIVGHTLAFYLRQVLWPAELAMDYGHLPEFVLQSTWSHWAWLVPLAVLAIAAALWRRSHVPLAAVAIFVLAPFHVLGWVPFDTQFFSTTADHYLYIAMLGVALLVGWLVMRSPARLGIAATVLLVLVLGTRSFIQAGTWRDTRSVFEHVLAVNPNSWLAHCNLGQLALDQKDPAAAIEHSRAAIAAQPRYVRSYTILGAALKQQGKPELALQVYSQILEILPDDVAALTAVGELRLQNGDAAGAEPLLRRAVQITPADVRARLNLAFCLTARGRRDEAVAQLQIAYRLQPQSRAIASLLQQLGAAPPTSRPAP